MGSVNTFFFDTYALIEIALGNSKYEAYKKCQPYVTIFNLAELNYNLKKIAAKEEADRFTKTYSVFEIPVEISDLIKAMDFKTSYRRLSAPDCIGYIMAQKLGVKFLTGDSGFENMENVEYVKK